MPMRANRCGRRRGTSRITVLTRWICRSFMGIAFVRGVDVFDQYRGKGVEPGKKSLALRIVMQDTDRTLTDSEMEGVVASIREQLNEKFKAKPRT